jgi:hypothetical protein
MKKNNSLNPKRVLITLLILFKITVSMADTIEQDKKYQDLMDKFDESKHEDVFVTKQEVENQTEIKPNGIYYYDSLRIKAFTDDYIFNITHSKKAFKLQYYSSILIFLLVITIVISGLVLSYKQFLLNESIIKNNLKNNINTMPEGTNSNTNLEIGKDGIKINTAIIGLIILVISLGFFLLYLKFVYQISLVK